MLKALMRIPGALLLVVGSVLLPGPATVAGDGTHDSPFLTWIDALARQIEARCGSAGVAALRLEVRGGRGVDPQRAVRAVEPWLRRSLDSRGTLRVVTEPGSPLLLLELSHDAQSAWAVGSLEGGALPAPLAVAASVPLDREIGELLLGGEARVGQASWRLERIGTLDAPVLDLALVEEEGGGELLALLLPDAVSLLRWEPLEQRLRRAAGPWPLPEPGPWPRVVAGWICDQGRGRLHVARTAGPSLMIQATSGSVEPLAGAEIALRQAPDPGHEPCLLLAHARSPAAASLDPRALFHDRLGTPIPARDVWRWPGEDELGVAILEDGSLQLLGKHAGPGVPPRLPQGRFGDRIVLRDLDGRSNPELVTSADSPPGEPDVVTVWAPGWAGAEPAVLFRSQLSGAVVGLAAGDLDDDGRTDVILAEELPSKASGLWCLKRAE
jgi:hypothetical protein